MQTMMTELLEVRLFPCLLTLPLCWALTRHVTRERAWIVGVTGAVVALLVRQVTDTWDRPLSNVLCLAILAEQILISMPAMLALTGWVRWSGLAQWPSEGKPAVRHPLVWCSLVVFSILPAYVFREHSVQGKLVQLAELQAQQRIGESVRLSREILKVSPEARYQEQPLKRFLPEWRTQVRLLQDQLTAPLNPEDYARCLAMLGDTDKALMVLQVKPDDEHSEPSRSLLAGTILQHEQRWQESHRCFDSVRKRLEQQPERNTQMLAAAYQGMGYCLRKQGDHRRAEAAYLSLLQLVPSADHHFLLAQFYKDAQVGTPAAHHAAQAARLDPNRYQMAAERMFEDLQANQLSCFQLWTRQDFIRSQSEASLSPQ